MNPLIVASLVSGGASLLSGMMGSAHSSAVASQDLRLQKLALEEQQRLNQFQMDEYLDKKDYDRALQERIFEREDTAMQRGLQDYVNAGFSPLSALGQTANAGSVVSTSSAPSLNAPSAPDLTGMYQAVQHLVDGGTQAGAMVSTFLAQQAQEQHDVNMENLRFANAMDTLSQGQENEKELLRLEADLREGSAQAQHLRELEKISQTNEFQKTMAEFQANLSKYLQADQQKWQSKQSETDRLHQLEMQQKSHDQTLDALGVQDKYKQQYERKTLAYAWSDLSEEGRKLFTRLISKFDKDLANFIANDTFGGDLLMRIVAMYESSLPVVSETKSLLNPLSDLFGK